MQEVVYTAASQLRAPAELLRGMRRDVRVSIGLGWRLFVRNLSGQYRQSLLGLLWAFVPPVATALVFAFLRDNDIFVIGTTEVPYLLFVLASMVFWQAFTDALRSPLQVLSASRAMLTKMRFPREALIIAAAGDVVFKLLLRVLPLMAVYLWYEGLPPPSALLALGPALCLVLLGLTLGLLLVPAGLLYGDVERALSLITMLWLFVTPVLYPPPTQWPASLLARFNPVSPLIETGRDLLFGHPTASLAAAGWVTASALLLLGVAWVIYRISMPHLVARLSA